MAVHIDTTTRYHGTTYKSGVTEWASGEVAVTYRRRTEWTAEQVCRFGTPESMREWMISRAIRGRINWVIADRADDFLTLSRWWTYAESRGVSFEREGESRERANECATAFDGIRLSRINCSERCSVLDYTADGIRWRIVGARNYWPDGCDVGAREGEGDGQVDRGVCDSGTENISVGVHRASQALSRIRCLCEWWRRVSTAPFGITAGQLAWGILRSHIPARSMCTHDCPDTHRLERQAAHGGRASLFYCGTSEQARRAGDSIGTRNGDAVHYRDDGAISLLDVQSMYPTLLRDESFPTHRIGLYGECSPQTLLDYCTGLGVIARVRIETECGEYPLRENDRVIYPVGTFTTVLAGPDLLALSHHGKILKVYKYALYRMGRPFNECMASLLAERERAAVDNDNDAQSFAKLLANSLAGKLAQNRGKWSRRSTLDCPGKWGEHHIINAQTHDVRRIQYICGAAREYERDADGSGPHTSAFCYLTAYGRQAMRAYRVIAGARAVISQDTDGIWVTKCGLDRLITAGALSYCGPGRLRIVRHAREFRFWGPRHYYTDGEWTLSGYKWDQVSLDRCEVHYRQTIPMQYACPRSAPSEVVTHYHVSPLSLDIGGGSADEDGWVSPPRRWLRWREE